jgi:hypothetical protein
MAANKITETITLKIAGTNFSASVTGGVTVDQVGTNYTEETQTITAAAPVQLDINPNIVEGNLGFLILKNVDVANAVNIATDSAMGNIIATIKATRAAYIPPPGGTVVLWAQAVGADVQVVFLACET